MCQCWYFSTPGSQYSLVDTKEPLHSKRALPSAWPILTEICQNSWQSSAMRASQVYGHVQADSAQSRVCMRAIIEKVRVGRILNNILRLTSVLLCWLLFAAWYLHLRLNTMVSFELRSRPPRLIAISIMLFLSKCGLKALHFWTIRPPITHIRQT